MNKYLNKFLFYYPATALKGERVRKYLQKYQEFEKLSQNGVADYQLCHFNNLVGHAKNHSDFYAKSLKNASSIKCLSELSELPYVTKETLKYNASEIQTNAHKWPVSYKTTGGSTGQAVTIAKNVDALARERAATWRGYSWAGVDIGDPQARFWGVPLQSISGFKYRAIDLIANRKRYSAFSINDESLYSYFQSINKFKPAYLYGYASFIHEFSQFLKKKDLKLCDSVKAIITTSEVLTDNMRKDIESVTSLRVYNEYGCGEVGSIAHECEHGSLHVMSDNLIVEIDAPKGEPGEIIVTDLFNYAMPLIRYRLGDFATLSNSECQCGRPFPIIEKVHGRAYDLLLRRDETKMHPEIAMYIFEEFKYKYNAVDQFQLIQQTSSQITINLVVNQSYNKILHEDYFTSEFNKVFNGKMSYIFNYTNNIAREKSGKLRLIKSELTF